MAASSSLFSSSMHMEMFAPKTSKCPQNFVCCHSKISYIEPNYLKPVCCPNSRSLSMNMSSKWEQTDRRDALHCRALKIEPAPSFSVGQKFQFDDIIEAQQFDRDILSAIFEVARNMENVEKDSPGSQILKGFLMATLFYEPSTRTRLSFESAMRRLGGEVLTTENAREFSSAAKGETLEGEFPLTPFPVCCGFFFSPKRFSSWFDCRYNQNN